VSARPALNHIGGAWVGSSSHATVEDRNPARTDELLANAAASTADDVRHAIDAAEKAYPAWRATPAPQRGDIVRKAADLMERRRDQLARLCTQEEGKVLAESFAEVDRAIGNVRFSGEQGSPASPARRSRRHSAARSSTRRVTRSASSPA